MRGKSNWNSKNPPEALKDHRDARFILWRIASEVTNQVQALTQMEYYDDLDDNYLTYKDYDEFCQRFDAQKLDDQEHEPA